MGRQFHVSCLGPIAASSVNKQALESLVDSASISAELAKKMLSAKVGVPCRIEVKGNFLRSARVLDKALLKAGLLSHICWCDSANPEQVQLFVNERERERRVDVPSALIPVKKRGSGRRAEDANPNG